MNLRFCLAITLFLFCASGCFCSSQNLKEKLVKSILAVIVDRKALEEQEQELIEKIIENLKKADHLLIRDMLEWKQSEREEEELRKRFFELEKAAFAKLRKRLSVELNLYQTMLRASARLYMRAFTTEELKVLRKFYATQAGKKSLLFAQRAHSHFQDVIHQKLVPKATQISKEIQRGLVESFMVQEP